MMQGKCLVGLMIGVLITLSCSLLAEAKPSRRLILRNQDLLVLAREHRQLPPLNGVQKRQVTQAVNAIRAGSSPQAKAALTKLLRGNKRADAVIGYILYQTALAPNAALRRVAAGLTRTAARARKLRAALRCSEDLKRTNLTVQTLQGKCTPKTPKSPSQAKQRNALAKAASQLVSAKVLLTSRRGTMPTRAQAFASAVGLGAAQAAPAQSGMSEADKARAEELQKQLAQLEQDLLNEIKECEAAAATTCPPNSLYGTHVHECATVAKCEPDRIKQLEAQIAAITAELATLTESDSGSDPPVPPCASLLEDCEDG